MGDPSEAVLEVRAYATEHPDVDAFQIAREFSQKLEGESLRWFAWLGLKEYVDGMRRAEVRQIENESSRKVSKAEVDSALERLSVEHLDSCKDEPREPYAHFVYFRDNPDWYGGNRKWREEFKKWMGDGFAEWHTQAASKILETGGERDRDNFIASFSPEGPMAWWDHRRCSDVLALVREHGEYVKLKVTRELLGSTFALGNGAVVTWGEATVDQHEQRIGLLVGNAAGNVETASRHLSAIKMIRSAGANRLLDVAEAKELAVA